MSGPIWMLCHRLFTPEECQALIAEADRLGWEHGTYADGTRRENVSVCFLEYSPHDRPVARAWIEKLRAHAASLATVFGLQVWPEKLWSLQLSYWAPGDHYGYHADHDPTGVLPLDRKLSIFVSLSEGGVLGLDRTGPVTCQTGDALIFPSFLSHEAPATEHQRWSMVAWIPGPDWT